MVSLQVRRGLLAEPAGWASTNYALGPAQGSLDKRTKQAQQTTVEAGSEKRSKLQSRPGSLDKRSYPRQRRYKFQRSLPNPQHSSACVVTQAGKVFAWGNTVLSYKSEDVRTPTTEQFTNLNTGIRSKRSLLSTHTVCDTSHLCEPTLVIFDEVVDGEDARDRLAVREDGTLWTWGSNNHGQLG